MSLFQFNPTLVYLRDGKEIIENDNGLVLEGTVNDFEQFRIQVIKLLFNFSFADKIQ